MVEDVPNDPYDHSRMWRYLPDTAQVEQIIDPLVMFPGHTDHDQTIRIQFNSRESCVGTGKAPQDYSWLDTVFEPYIYEHQWMLYNECN
jgi:hypothetical protein